MTERRDSAADEPLEETEERNDAVIARAMWWSIAAAACLATGIGGFVYFSRPAEGPPAPEAPPARLAGKRELPPVNPPALSFTDVTKSAGVDFVHENGASEMKLLPETMGGGVAFLDYDGDDDPDLLFVGSKRWDEPDADAGGKSSLALYGNDGAGGFTDVTATAGLTATLFGMGVAVGDFDNDGFPDVYITGLNENRLYRNLGDGTFADVTPHAGVAGDANAWSTSAGFFDYDNDGNLDLFVCNYLNWTREFDAGQSFTLDGKQRAYGQPQRFPGAFCYLFRNNGDGTFADVSQSAGIQVVFSKKGTPAAKALGVCFADMNGDGSLDVVVANDTTPKFLFRNNRDGTFQETGVAANFAFDANGGATGAMGVDAERFRNSGELGVAVGNFSNEMTALYVAANREMLFTDVAIANGVGPVTRNELTFGLFFFDADLDGRLDLFAANGHLESDIAKVQARQSYEQPPQLLWNAGPGHATEFVPVVAPDEPTRRPGESPEQFQQRIAAHTAAAADFQRRMGDFVRPMVGRGAAFADVDGDGDLDVAIVGNGQPARLLRNDQALGRNWLQVKLTGRESNRSAIGATVEVHLAGGKTLHRQVMPTRSYLSQVEPVLTFGLGTAKNVERVTITWPSGKTTEIRDNVSLNRRLDLIEP